MKQFMQIMAVVGTLVILPMPSISVAGDDMGWDKDDKNPNRVVKIFRGYPVTGVNNVLGKPLYDFGSGFGTFNFPTVAVYNEFGDAPLPLTEHTPDSAILATVVDPNFLFLSGFTQEDMNPEWDNIPLRKVKVNVDLALIEKRSLPGALEIAQSDYAQAEPANPITKGQWMAAKGVAKIDCADENRAVIKLQFKSMIPNRMYGVWALIVGNNPRVFPIGGVPNIFMTDENGDAEFKRTIAFCPMIVRPGDDVITGLIVQFHSALQSYGGAPEPVRATGHDGYGPKNLVGGWVGLVTHAHMDFPINVQVLGKR